MAVPIQKAEEVQIKDIISMMGVMLPREPSKRKRRLLKQLAQLVKLKMSKSRRS